MTSLFKNLWPLLCTVFLYGCSTPVPKSVPTVSPEPIAEPDIVEDIQVPTIGRLTLIRTEPEPSADEVLIYTNDVLLAVIGNQSYVELDFPVGIVVLTLDWQDTPMKFKEQIKLEPSYATNKFLTISHQFDVPEISKNEGGTDYTMEETLILFELPERFGTNVIKNLDPEFSYVFGPVD